MKFEKSTMQPLGTYRDTEDEVFLFLSDKRWMYSPVLISLYSLALRVGATYEGGDWKEHFSNGNDYIGRNDKTYTASAVKALDKIVGKVLLLAACSGEEYGLKEPEVQRGLAIRDAGLDPLDPEPLTRPIAWVDARDADSVVVHYAFVGDDSVVAELALLPSGFVRWEIELPPRAAEESLDYRFEALTGAGTAGLGPFRVSPTPFTIDFPWPGWPDPAYNWPTRGDISRVNSWTVLPSASATRYTRYTTGRAFSFLLRPRNI